jgi:hypothetical protein
MHRGNDRYAGHFATHVRHCRRTFDSDGRVRSRLETFSPVNPAAFPCHKYVAPDPPFVIESHKMFVIRLVSDRHYLYRSSNLVRHTGTS